MILEFPHFDTLHLAMTSQAAPLSLTGSAARAALGEGQVVFLEPTGRISRTTQNDLKKFGVKFHKAVDFPLPLSVTCWAQLLPTVRSVTLPEPTEKTPVLFDLPDGAALPEVVAESLRLGNDRQAYRWLAPNPAASSGPASSRSPSLGFGPDGQSLEAAGRGLLRVMGPPYYTLLRALDRRDGDRSPVAFLERNSRVWVQFGYEHPLQEKIKIPAGKLLLIRPPHSWEFLDEGPFQDVYELLEMTLEAPPRAWYDTQLDQKLSVPLRLVPGAAHEAAELWVLTGKGVDQLDQLVRDADDRLLSRLLFAVGTGQDSETSQAEATDRAEAGGRPETVIVRVRPTKQQPPVLVLDATQYHTFRGVPNLFVPIGSRLHPPLRRDAIVKLLAPDTKRVVWLRPHEDRHSFTPESLSETAFRPLKDWVEYVLDHERVPLQSWMAAMQFEFEPFVCKGDKPAKTKPDQDESDRSSRRSARERETDRGKTSTATRFRHTSSAESQAALEPPAFLQLQKRQPRELEEELHRLEKEFLDLLDSPATGSSDPSDDQQRESQQKALWSRMAELNTILKHASDATVCWLNCLWDRDPQDRLRPLIDWYVAESQGPSPAQLTCNTLEAMLSEQNPMPATLRQLAAYLAWSAEQGEPASFLLERLGQVQHFLEQHEALLPVRAAWLAWNGLVALSDGDVLALARARDRLLERLHTNGLSPDQDLPSFLRASGLRTSDRFRQVREQVRSLRDQAREWADKNKLDELQMMYSGSGPYTKGYVDLIFAYGLAKLGETHPARELLESGQRELRRTDIASPEGTPPDSEVNEWLREAYEYRIRQGLEGRPNAGPLPAELMQNLQQWDRPAQQGDKDPESRRLQMICYKIGQLRTVSKILQPYERINAFAYHLHDQQSELANRLAALFDESNPEQIVTTFTQYLPTDGSSHLELEDEVKAVLAALALSPRLGEAFSGPILGRVEPLLNRLQERRDEHPAETITLQLQLLERALVLAAHFDQSDYVQAFLARFRSLLATSAMNEALPAVRDVLIGLFNGLRKLGLRDELNELIDHMAAVVNQQKKGKTKNRGRENDQQLEVRVRRLELLLHVAAGWFYFGENDAAAKIVNEARDLLFSDQVKHLKLDLARAYVAALAQAPVDGALKYVSELFSKLAGIRDTQLTMSHYSVLQLEVIESVVLAMVSDDFALDQAGRRWLDDDTYSVYRRINRDVRQAAAV